MPRIARRVIQGEKPVYHIMSRTALDGYPSGAAEKDEFVCLDFEIDGVYSLKHLSEAI